METWKDTVAMLLAAVEIEQEAVLQRPARSSDTVRADRVERVTDSNGTVRYHLRTSQWPSAWSDAVEIRATAPSPWVAAEAVTVAPSADARHFDIDLDVASPLPASTASLEVRSDDAGVLRMLARKLGSIGAEDSPIQPRLAMAATMPGGQTKIGRDKSAADLVVSKTANIPQRRAVEQSLGSELTFIWGPPGTGKSDVVANIIVGYRRRGWRVLFVAPTHLAVDQALLRVCDQLVGDPVFHEGLVQRKNGSRLPALTSRFGDQIDAAATLARLQKPLRAHSRRLAAEISTVAAATQLLREAARLDQTVRASRTEEQRLTAELAQAPP